MREPEIVEGTLAQGLCVRALAGQPGGDGRLSEAEDPFGSRWVQPFGQREIRILAICSEGVFKRYKGVWRRAVKVVRQA